MRGLSSDHHQALVLARTLARRAAAGTADADLALSVRERFERELAPHFRVEEEVLLPALRRAGEVELVKRTEADHAWLRAEANAAGKGRTAGLAAFAERLLAHVRFEERELFPRCEAVLDDDVLAEAARRAPWGGDADRSLDW